MDPSGLKPLYYGIVRFWYVLGFPSHIAEKMDFKWDNSYNGFWCDSHLGNFWFVFRILVLDVWSPIQLLGHEHKKLTFFSQ